MKTLLTTLNSKFIHSNLAIRSLKAFCKEDFPDIELMEFAINDNYGKIVKQIYSQRPDLVGFSCYIWNIRQTLDIAETIKRILPGVKILLGGPEVTYESVHLFNKYSFIDFIALGEGESTLYNLLKAMQGKTENFSHVKGLIWRRSNDIYQNDPTVDVQLDSIPFPYDQGFRDLKNKIIYYESSRGCPYNCQYCLSSNTRGVKFLSIDRVKDELKYFVDSKIKQVKLVDRTFNCNLDRAKEIFTYLIELGGGTNFHFEMAGDLIDEEMLSILKKAPKGLFQFEIGIQSTNLDVLSNVKRKSNLGKIKRTITDIIRNDNIHVHLDLIAGLPGEGLSSISRSINSVIRLRPHRLQLGFLKLLKGSGLRDNADAHGYNYTQYPPYEVLSNKYITYDELWRLKEIEIIIDKYYNSHRFVKTTEYMLKLYNNDAYVLFSDISKYWQKKDYFKYSHSNEKLYSILLEFAQSGQGENVFQKKDIRLINDLLLFDFCHHVRPGRYPYGLKRFDQKNIRQMVREYFKGQSNIKRHIGDFEATEAKRKVSRMHAEMFSYKVNKDKVGPGDEENTLILFDYDRRDKVLNKALVQRLDIKPYDEINRLLEF